MDCKIDLYIYAHVISLLACSQTSACNSNSNIITQRFYLGLCNYKSLKFDLDASMNNLKLKHV